MATYNIPLSSPIGSNIFVDTASSTTLVQISATSGTLYSFQCDNGNSSVACFPKLWDSLASPTLGTTAMNVQIKARANQENEGITYGPLGWTFTNGLWLATTTGAGTTNTGTPATAPIVRVLYS